MGSFGKVNRKQRAVAANSVSLWGKRRNVIAQKHFGGWRTAEQRRLEMEALLKNAGWEMKWKTKEFSSGEAVYCVVSHHSFPITISQNATRFFMFFNFFSATLVS